MFSTKSLSIWLSLSFLSLICFFQLTKAVIVYQPNWEIPYPGKPDDRAVYLVGNVKDYEIKTENYDAFHPSDAQCETKLSDNHFTGPCLTNVTYHNQILSVQCLHSKGSASVNFFYKKSSLKNQAQIITSKDIWAGFTNEDKDKPLLQSGSEPLVGEGDRISAVFSCTDNKRGNFGISKH